MAHFPKLNSSSFDKFFETGKFEVKSHIVQWILDLVTNLVSVKSVTKSRNVTKFIATYTTKSISFIGQEKHVGNSNMVKSEAGRFIKSILKLIQF